MAAVSVIVALQHLEWLTGVTRALMAYRSPAHELSGIVFTVTVLCLYATFTLLYQLWWQPMPRRSSASGPARWLYSLVGLGIGWAFGAMLLVGVLESRIVQTGEIGFPAYEQAITDTADKITAAARFFIPDH
jgi:hypothetical protein